MVTSAAIRFGELTIEQHGDGFVLRGPDALGEAVSVPCESTELSARVRTDDRGRYRPLSGARTMPSGWKTVCTGGGELESALEAVYPLAGTHRAQWRDGTLRVLPPAAVLERQTGRYEIAADLSNSGREFATQALCGDCVRTPVWDQESLLEGGIPCPEACSVLVALCREAAIWETGRPGRTEIDASVAYAEFDLPGNAMRETVLGNMELEGRL